MFFFLVLRSKKPWWQSQTGVENVTITLDLETVFYFSYLYLKFKTFRPAGMVVERSSDYGVTWQVMINADVELHSFTYGVLISPSIRFQVYGYFAENCPKQFPGTPTGPQRNLSLPYCTEKYSSDVPF